MLKNLSIKARLIGVLCFLCVQLIAGAVIGLVALSGANDAMKSVYDNRLVPLGQLDQIVRLLAENELSIAKAISDEPQEAAAVMDKVEQNIRLVSSTWDAYMATHLTSDERRLAEQFAADRTKFVSEGLRPAMAAVHAQDAATATGLLHGPMEKLFAPAERGINALIQLQQDVAKRDFEEAQRMYVLVRNSCIAALAFGLLLAAGVGLWLLRAITRPLDQAILIADRIAAGDLTQPFPARTRNEMGRLLDALKNMNDGLARIVVQVRSGTDTMTTASAELAAGNQDLSARTEEQASSLEETASSMEELTSTVKQNADNANQANMLADTASQVASKGGAVVEEVVQTMGAINDSSRKIVDIISVIDGIAFQTNILALNAAVEAARAGEQGRGFAVVASEVRALAQRSAAAAKEIKSLIDDSVAKVGTGTTLVNEAGSTMQEILESVRRVSDIVSEISAASREQSAGIEQINQAVTQMDQVTQQNAALVEEASAASESLQEEARKLAETVSVFKVQGNADAAAPRVRAAHATPPTGRANVPAKVVPKKVAAPVRAPSRAAGSDDWEEF